MHYQLSSDSFTQIPFETGTIQNINERATVEICVDSTANSGLVLYPREKYEWDDATVYARAKWSDGEIVTIAALPLLKSGGGGGGGGGTDVTIEVGTTTTGAPGTPASVTNSGTNKNVVLNFTIPSGSDGGIYDWSAGITYKAEDLVLFGDHIYKCTEAHTSSTWAGDADKWIPMDSASAWEPNTVYLAGQLVSHGEDLYRVNTTFTSGNNFSPAYMQAIGAWKIYEWESNSTYTLGSILHYQGQLYRVTTGMTTSSTFDDIPLMEGYVVPKWKPGRRYPAGALLQNGSNRYEVTQDFTAGEAFSIYCMEVANINTWTANTAYAAGDIIINDNVYYEVLTDFTSGATFDSTNLQIYVYTPVYFTVNTIYAEGQLIDNDGTIYKAIQGFKSGNAFSVTCLSAYTAIAWTADTSYAEGDILEYEDDLYVVLRNFHSGAWFTTAVLEKYTPQPLTAQQIADCIDEYGGEMVAAGTIYSSRSDVAGTWIDGRSIYQKTFAVMTPANASDTAVASLAGLGISRVINNEGYVYDALDGCCYPLNFSNAIKTWSDIDNDVVMMAVTDHFSSPAYITIRYIK